MPEMCQGRALLGSTDMWMLLNPHLDLEGRYRVKREKP